MKKWQVILGTMLALVVTALTPLTALAQSGEETTAADKPSFRGALAIVAPRAVAVDKEMSLGVFLRENQNPVPGAGVWALTKNSAEALREEAAALQEKLSNAEDADYESLLGERGRFLGRTKEDGRLFHTLKEEGTYVLVAAKRGFVPDFSPLVVGGGNKPNALVVKAPRVSPPGESVTISVTERGSGDAVKDAGVWAVTREKAEDLKSQLGETRTDSAAPEVDVESLLNGRGMFLGRTNGNGELKHTFKEEGVYVLIAFKKGYFPGFIAIGIKNQPKALAIHAPQSSPVGESITIKVTERGSGDAVKDAGVWALTPAEAESLKAKLGNAATVDNVTAVDAESILNGRGIFLGRTNGNGEVKHTFNEAGRYILIAAKRGYIPGYSGIAIIAPRPNTKPTLKPAEKPALTPRTLERPNLTPRIPEKPKPSTVPGNTPVNPNPNIGNSN